MPRLDAAASAEAMFDEEEFTTGLEDAVDFREGAIDILDTTEGPGAEL